MIGINSISSGGTMGRTDLKGKAVKGTVTWVGRSHPWKKKRTGDTPVVAKPQYISTVLKPCPFCGVVPDYKTYPTGIHKHGYKYEYSIECNTCHQAKTLKCYTRKDSIQSWNERRGE
jgi:hypothetical protein